MMRRGEILENYQNYLVVLKIVELYVRDKTSLVVWCNFKNKISNRTFYRNLYSKGHKGDVVA